MHAAMQVDEVRGAQAAFALAARLVYVEPDGETLAAYWETHLFDGAPFGNDDAEVRGGLFRLQSFCAALDLSDAPAFDEAVGALQREWLRLFVGLGAPEAPCWESFYHETSGTVFGRKTLEVREWYRRYGLQVERLYSEPDDHLGLMLGFLGHLGGLEADAREGGSEAAAGEAAEAQGAFLADHLLAWLPAWRFYVHEHASSEFYRGTADLVFGLLRAYARRFDILYREEERIFSRRAPESACGA